MTTLLKQIENESYQIDSAIEKHGGQLEPVTQRLLKQLTSNIRYHAGRLEEVTRQFSKTVLGEEQP